METFNKTISNFETKPYEILQDKSPDRMSFVPKMKLLRL